MIVLVPLPQSLPWASGFQYLPCAYSVGGLRDLSSPLIHVPHRSHVYHTLSVLIMNGLFLTIQVQARQVLDPSPRYKHPLWPWSLPLCFPVLAGFLELPIAFKPWIISVTGCSSPFQSCLKTTSRKSYPVPGGVSHLMVHSTKSSVWMSDSTGLNTKGAMGPHA